MGHYSKPLKVAPVITGTVTSGDTDTITFPVGVQYFKITSKSTSAGTLQWAWTTADIVANEYHELAVDESTDNIIANPLTLAFKASGGDVDYSIFAVIEGK